MIINKKLMLVDIKNVVVKGEKKTMHTFINDKLEITKGYRPDHDVKDYADKLVTLVGELAYDDSKASLFPFEMNEWEGKTTFRLQAKPKK
jgi:hypothetical protein